MNNVLVSKAIRLLLFFILLPTGSAIGQTVLDPATLLVRIDSVASAPSDMTAMASMTLIDRDGDEKQRTVRLRQKGSELRLIQFLEPADVRGVGFLRQSSDRLYLYLPAFRRVRRISSSGLDESFAGTDFTYQDLSQNRYSSDYTPRSVRSEEGRFVLELVPSPDARTGYARLELITDPADYAIRHIRYFDESNELIKRLDVGDVVGIDGYVIGRRMEMTDVRDRHRTILVLSEIRFDQGLGEGAFSERSLKRPIR